MIINEVRPSRIERLISERETQIIIISIEESMTIPILLGDFLAMWKSIENRGTINPKNTSRFHCELRLFIYHSVSIKLAHLSVRRLLLY